MTVLVIYSASLWPCFLHRGPSIHAAYQVSVHFGERFQKRRFKKKKKRPIRNKNCLWRACLLTDWDKIRNLYRGLLCMLPTKFHFIWGSGLRREDFSRNRPIRKKNYLWLPCLLTDRDKMSIFLSSLRRRFLEIDESKTRIACGGHVC